MPLSVRLSVALLLLVCAFDKPSAASAAEAAVRAEAARSITAEKVKSFVDALADDTFEGREAGTRGNRAAGGYIVEEIKKLGFFGGGPKGSYFQPFGSYRNILAFAEGSDPALKNQVIIVSAHYDHVGYGTNRNSYGPIGRIHNGADDNASGVAGLLQVMDAVSKLPKRPRRSILFAFWDGEEKGLLGSEHWASAPTVPLANVAMMINVDMIGRLRNQRVDVSGIRTAAGLRRLVSELNGPEPLVLDFNWDIRPDSDHQSFYSRGIPYLMMHTGKHPEYHRPSDDAELINNAGLSQIAHLMFNVVVELADAETLSAFRGASRSESNGLRQMRERGLAPPPGRLGLRWDAKRAAEDGAIVVEAVTPGSPAAAAGIQPGDRVLSIGGREIHSADQFRLCVLAADNPATATIQRAGTESPLELTLNLRGNPSRLGISWRTDDAEPGVVIVNRVVPGSAAEMAGVRVGDRIYRINGQTFADAEAFRQAATQATGPIVLETERAGQVRSAELPSADAPPMSDADA
jgi:hypothetical protein